MEIESQGRNNNDDHPSRIKIFFREHFLLPVFVVLTILMLIIVQIRYVFIVCGGLAFLYFVRNFSFRIHTHISSVNSQFMYTYISSLTLVTHLLIHTRTTGFSIHMDPTLRGSVSSKER